MPPKHGTTYQYNQKGCRCKRCKTANKMRHRKYMKEHPEQQEKARLRSRAKYGLDPEKRRPPVMHGTSKGVASHKRRKTALCKECKAFVKADTFMREVRRKERLAPCGTPGALRRHYRNNEPIDDLCRTMFNRTERTRRKEARNGEATSRGVSAD